MKIAVYVKEDSAGNAGLAKTTAVIYRRIRARNGTLQLGEVCVRAALLI